MHEYYGINYMTEHLTSRADLHVHPNGQNKGLFQDAQKYKVRVIGALDHTMLRTDHAKVLIGEGEKQGITILSGVEMLLRARHEGQEILYELSCLGVDPSHPQIFNTLDPRGEVYSEIHRQKIAFQRDFLIQQGFNMNLSEETQATEKVIASGLVAATAALFCDIAANHPANRQRLAALKRELAEELELHHQRRPEDQGQMAKFLYWQYFAADKPGFRRWGKPTDPFELIRVIHEGGGVVVVAHPQDLPSSFVDHLLDVVGVDGVEGWDAGPLNEDMAEKAYSRDRLVAGGSGKNYTEYRNRVLGLGDKNRKDMFIPPTILDEIRNYKRKAGIS